MRRGRPPTSMGTWGTIRTKQVRDGVYRARTRIRDKDGVTREVTATGTTTAAAERALREKLVDRAAPSRQAITADTRIARLAELWLGFLRDEGRIEATTIKEYVRVLKKVVIPELGGVLGAMLGLAVRNDALPVNPAQQTSRIQAAKAETRSLTLENLETVRKGNWRVGGQGSALAQDVQ